MRTTRPRRAATPPSAAPIGVPGVRRATRLLTAALTIAVLSLTASCAPEPRPAASPTPSATPTSTPTPTPTPTPDPLARLTIEQRVGQLFVVGTSVDAPDPVTLSAVSAQHAGGVFLHGRSGAGVEATAAFTQVFRDARPMTDPPLWIATDQEGGDVQVLSGPGFDDIPTALTQSSTEDAQLRTDAARWGGQLRAAGIDLNLAPVVDIVSGPDAVNPPIGALNRAYGFDEAAVSAHAGAFAAGMRDAGVLPTLKHFPGLGRVTENTDYGTGVTDDTVGADAPDVAVYRALLSQRPAVVMLSSAVYARIDPSAPALFSPAVVTGLLREQVGFEGVVMTDDVSAADQVAAWSPADRAVLAISAGVDVVLVSADPTVFPEMYEAVLARARSDAAFAELVDAAAKRVVAAKTAGVAQAEASGHPVYASAR